MEVIECKIKYCIYTYKTKKKKILATDIRLDWTNERTKWILWKFNAMEKRSTNHYIAQLQLPAFELFKSYAGLSVIEDYWNRFNALWVGGWCASLRMVRNMSYSTSKWLAIEIGKNLGIFLNWSGVVKIIILIKVPRN